MTCKSNTVNRCTGVGTMKSRIQNVRNYRLQPTVYLASRVPASDTEGMLAPRLGSTARLAWEPRAIGVAELCGRQLRTAPPGEPVAPLN